MQNRADFRFIERVMIQHAHPLKLTVDILGIMIGWYLLWTHHLLLAIATLFGMSILGTLLVWKQDISQLYKTKLGKWMIGQAEPVNLVVRSMGFVFLCYGFWSHSLGYFPLGIIMLIAARFLGSKAKSAQES